MTARKGNQYLLYMDDAPYTEGVISVAANSTTLSGYDTKFTDAKLDAGATISIIPAQSVYTTGSAAVTAGSAVVTGTSTTWNTGGTNVAVGQTFIIGAPETVTVTRNWRGSERYPGQTVIKVESDESSTSGSEIRIRNLSSPVYDVSKSPLLEVNAGDRFISSASGDFSVIEGSDLRLCIAGKSIAKISSVTPPIEHRIGSIKAVGIGDNIISGKGTQWASENNIRKGDVIAFKDDIRSYTITDVLSDEEIKVTPEVQNKIKPGTKYVIKSRTKIFVESGLDNHDGKSYYSVVDAEKKPDIDVFETKILRKISKNSIELEDPIPGYTAKTTTLEAVGEPSQTFTSKIASITSDTSITLEDESPISATSTTSGVNYAIVTNPNGTATTLTISTVDGNEKITVTAGPSSAILFARYSIPRETLTLVAGLTGDTTSRSDTPADSTSKDSVGSNGRYREMLANSGTPAWSHASSGVLRSTLDGYDCVTKGNKFKAYLVTANGDELIPGARSNTLSMQDPIVEITAKDSFVTTGTNINRRYRELCPRAGTPMLSMTAAGVLNDDTTVAGERVSLADFSVNLGGLDTINMKIVIPGFATVTGPFILTNYEESGDNNDVGTYTYTIESAGDWVLSDYDRGNRILTGFRADSFREFQIREYSSAASPVLQQTYAGKFQISQYDMTGDNDAIGTFSIQLESSEFIEIS